MALDTEQQIEIIIDQSQPTVDLTTLDGSGTINDAIFSIETVQPAGSGVIDSFVRIEAQGNGTSEEGYNTDYRPVEFDEKTDAVHTHAVLLSDVPMVTVDGVQYREFFLDINEARGTGPTGELDQLLSLDQLKIYVAGTAELTGFGATGFDPSAATLVYNMDTGGDHWVALNAALSHGSGQSDMRVLIPEAAFDGSSGDQYVYLYSSFGDQHGLVLVPVLQGQRPDVLLVSDAWRTNSGFEEWWIRVTSQTPPEEHPAIGIDKVTGNGGTVNGDGLTVLAGSDIVWTYSVSNTGDVALSNVTVVDDNGTADTGDDVVVGTIANLGVGATATLTLSGTAEHADYSNLATATGTSPLNASVVATDASGYHGVVASIAIDKVTGNGGSINGDGLTVLAGSSIVWTYSVTNTGDVALSSVEVGDDKLGVIASGVTLGAGETATYQVSGVAEHTNYTNTGSAGGSFTDDLGNTANPSANDGSGYRGVVAGIAIDKVTGNGGSVNGDGLTILAGSSIVWTYSVTNTGDVALSSVEVGDDKLGVVTSGVTLGAGETATFQVNGVALHADYANTGSASGSFTDDLGNTANPSASDGSGYHGVIAGIDVEKTVFGVDTDAHRVYVHQGINPTFSYVVTNTGDVELSGVVLSDDRLGVLALSSGDTDNDGRLDVGETWTYGATGAWGAGTQTNVAHATGSFTDDLGNVARPFDDDAATYTGLAGPGVRTPGFWSNWTSFWDGVQGNEPSKGGILTNFPTGDVLYKAYDPVGGALKTGLLIGDYNMNGITDSGEHTIFYTTQEALTIVNASTKVQQDARYILDRDVVASWLDYLAGNSIGDASDPHSPHHYLDQGIDWLRAHTPNEAGGSDAGGDGSLTLSASSWKTASSDAAWNSAVGGIDAGNHIHQQLDGYNNTGRIDGIIYAWDGDVAANPGYFVT